MDLKYPNDLVCEVIERWSKLPRASVSRPTPPEGKLPGRHILLRGVASTLPACEILKEIIGVIYHVSFQTEESRKLAVTVAYLRVSLNNRFFLIGAWFTGLLAGARKIY